MSEGSQHLSLCQRRRRTRRVPSGKDDASVHRVFLDLPDNLSELVNTFSRVIGIAVLVFRTKMPPLEAVHRSEVALASMRQTTFVEELARAVSIPYLHPSLRQQLRVRLASDKPDELLDDTAQEDPFCRQERERVIFEGKSEVLWGENRKSSRAGPVFPKLADLQDLFDEGGVLLFFVFAAHRGRWQSLCVTQCDGTRRH